MPTRWKFSGLPIENDRLIRGCRLVHVHVATSMFSLALSTCFLLAMTSDVQAHSLQLSLGPVLVHHGLPSSRSSFCGKGSLMIIIRFEAEVSQIEQRMHRVLESAKSVNSAAASIVFDFLSSMSFLLSLA